MMIRRTLLMLLAIGGFAGISTSAKAQALVDSEVLPALLSRQRHAAAIGSDLHASDREDETAELLFRYVWPLSHRRCGNSRWH